jgi:hypothetical protein
MSEASEMLDMIENEAKRSLKEMGDLFGWKYSEEREAIQRELPICTFGVGWKWRKGMTKPAYFAFILTPGGALLTGTEYKNSFAALGEAIRMMDEVLVGQMPGPADKQG